ncbi:MAG: pantetheine-phosphate adenylyltransferase [Bifidobacteriaceae bacterium]|jgi:pantetheine-phosphate adenylyltransferase|nr:pantetheine-phosphate adenylyltransferase [Bifidobacteriaceae bacterium]
MMRTEVAELGQECWEELARGRGSLAVVPGSFDPVTLGHVDVIERAAALFGSVIVGVADNAAKRPLLDVATRLELVAGCVADLAGVRVARLDGLLAEFCRAVGATAIVKGLRGGHDWGHEAPMALVNRELTGVETVLLVAAPDWAHVSSSIVKDVARHGGDVGSYVSPDVAAALARAFGRASARVGVGWRGALD